jgi:hypothetical protein
MRSDFDRPVSGLEANVSQSIARTLPEIEQPQGPFGPVPGARSPWAIPAGAGQEFWRSWLPGVSSIAARGQYSAHSRS